MPFYDYCCEDCGYEMEAFHAMSAEPLKLCPRCNKSSLIRLIGPGRPPIIKGTQTPCVGGRELKQEKSKKNKEKPFWRDGEIDKSILKNPEKYIMTGEV